MQINYMNNKLPWILFGIACLGLAGMLSYNYGRSSSVPVTPTTVSVQQTPAMIASVSVMGVVQSVSGNEIHLATSTPALPGAPSVIVVSSDTKFYKAGAKKDPAAYQKEFDAFQAEQVKNPSTNAIYPSNFEELPATLADVRGCTDSSI